MKMKEVEYQNIPNKIKECVPDFLTDWEIDLVSLVLSDFAKYVLANLTNHDKMNNVALFLNEASLFKSDLAKQMICSEFFQPVFYSETEGAQLSVLEMLLSDSAKQMFVKCYHIWFKEFYGVRWRKYKKRR